MAWMQAMLLPSQLSEVDPTCRAYSACCTCYEGVPALLSAACATCCTQRRPCFAAGQCSPVIILARGCGALLLALLLLLLLGRPAAGRSAASGRGLLLLALLVTLLLAVGSTVGWRGRSGCGRGLGSSWRSCGCGCRLSSRRRCRCCWCGLGGSRGSGRCGLGRRSGRRRLAGVGDDAREDVGHRLLHSRVHGQLGRGCGHRHALGRSRGGSRSRLGGGSWCGGSGSSSSSGGLDLPHRVGAWLVKDVLGRLLAHDLEAPDALLLGRGVAVLQGEPHPACVGDLERPHCHLGARHRAHHQRARHLQGPLHADVAAVQHQRRAGRQADGAGRHLGLHVGEHGRELGRQHHARVQLGGDGVEGAALQLGGQLGARQRLERLAVRLVDVGLSRGG
mmetsp:Transcript_13425/g.32804  ORF Transcript_13425/g.32804 Transcript_13425/m.32804 type:complete len:392 (+) Transcript_13425:445-1620(+)